MNRHMASLRIFVLCLALAIPAAAAAQWYVGVGIGRTNNEFLPTFAPSAGESIDDSDTAYKIFVGRNLGPNFAVELEYADLNTLVKATAPGFNAQVDATTLAASFIGKFQVHPAWTMFGRLGIGRWDTDLTVNTASASGNGVDTVVGLGLDYAFRDNFLFRVEWTQYQNVGQNVSTADTKLTGQNVDVLWLRLMYRFRLAPG